MKTSIKKQSQAALAMGPRCGDHIQLRNQWACVSITRDDVAGQPTTYVVDGDIADERASVKEFPTLTKALTYAWHSLAVYQNGRVD
jgi:hypothetical protein